MIVARMPSTLGATLLEELASGLETSARQDATAWVLQQYAMLQQLPARLTRAGAIAQNLRPVLNRVSQTEPVATLDSIAPRLADLKARYPAMMLGVEHAIQVIRSASAGAAPGQGRGLLETASQTVAAVFSAQQFVGDTADLENRLKNIIDELLSTNAISPAEATALSASGDVRAQQWTTYLLWGVGAYAAYRVLKMVL